MSKAAIAKAEKPSKKSGRSSGDVQISAKLTKVTKPEKEVKKSKKGKENEDAEENASRATKPSVLSAEEKSFPRGGASLLTPIERKQIQIQADRDALFEESGAGKKRPLPADVSDDEGGAGLTNGEVKPKKKRKTPPEGKKEKAPAEEKTERIEGLSFRKLVPGSTILGKVSQITSRDIALTLPNGLTGFVPLTSISKQLTSRVEKLLEEPEKEDEDSSEDDFEDVNIKKLFKIGQYLRASVVSNDDMRGGKKKRHLELSIDPRLANAGLTTDDLVGKCTVQAAVVSVEDGGLVMDLGIDGSDAKGFVSANELGEDIKHTDIEESAVMLCMVTGKSGNGRVIKLTADVAKMGDTKKGSSLTNAPSVKAFMPGTTANVLVSEVTFMGIRGSIMGMLDVTADLVHAGGAQGKQDLEKKHKVGSKVDARIVYSLNKDETRKVGVSIVEHVLSLSGKCLTNKQGASPLDQLAMSSTVSEAKVVKVDARNGIYLDVGVPRVYAFAHISQLSDKQVDSLSEDIGPYKIGSTHRARVTGYSAVDGLFTVTLKQSTLDQPFLRVQDVKLGEVVDGTIEDLPVKADGIAGIRLQLAEGIRGFVPVDHISDVKLKHPERKYHTGMKVKARVLSVNVGKRSIYLTMKKSIVGSEAKPWTRYEDLKAGDQSPGTIKELTPKGAWVSFFGSVRAFLPVREMSEAFIQDPAEHFRIGQVVNVHIISIDTEARRMLVSCKDSATLSNERQEKFDALEIGQLVDGSIVELGNELISLELDGGVQGHLRVNQLTDGSDKKNKSALEKLRAGLKLQKLVVLQKISKARTVRLSNKPSLVKAASKGKLLASFDRLKQGKVVHGFVSNINVSGIFVEFGDRLTGLIPVSGMPDEMRRLKMQDFGVVIGQSVSGRIWNIYLEDKRFTLTLREEEIIEPAKSEPVKPGTTIKTGTSRTLENPIDGKLSSVDDLIIGTQTQARVNAIKDFQLNISLADNVNGRVHVTEMFKKFEEIEDPKKPLHSIKHNTTLPVTVIGLHDAKTSKFLPLSHRQSVHPVIECSHKQAGSFEPVILSTLKLKEGEERLAFITEYSPTFALASLSPEVSGTIDVIELASVDPEYQKGFPIGCAVRVTVESVDVAKSKVHLSLIGARKGSEQKFEEGNLYVGTVRRSSEDGVDVQLSKNVKGFVPRTELTDNYDQAVPEKWSANQTIKVKVLANAGGKERLLLSARPSLTSGNDAAKTTVQDRHIASNVDVKFNDVVRGFVKAISKQGMLVRIGYSTIAQVPVHELSDEYLKKFETKFKVGQLVRGKIIKADPEQGHHKMSLRASVVDNANYKPEIGFGDLTLGDVVDAVVVKVEKYGVFIKVQGSKNVRGLCHVGELASTRVEDPSKLYSEGDVVKAKIIKLDVTKKHVNFSLKALHFQDLPEEASDAEGGVAVEDDEVEDEDEEMGGVDLNDVQDLESEQEDVGSDDEEMVDALAPSAKKRASGGGLKTQGFDWAGAADAEDDDAPQSEAEQELPKKKRKKAEIQVDRTGDLDALGPQSVSDFERLLLGQPNSSALWIQYMAFQLGLSEVDKAREVAERALRTIHMREEDEKMNIWVALLNLENTYGSEETLEAVFDRACQMSDKKTVYMRLASIYIDSGKHKVC